MRATLRYTRAMKKSILLLSSLALLPNMASAQDGSIQKIFTNLLAFFDTVLIPFLFGLAFLFFVINAIRFFVFESNNEDGREKARGLITYSVLGFVFLVIFWGLVNLLTSSLGLEGCRAPMSDYQAESFVGPNLPNC